MLEYGSTAYHQWRIVMNGRRWSSAFIADALALDFLNASAPPPHSKIEAMGTGDDLMAWLATANLASREELEAVRTMAVPGELDAIAVQARALGEWFRGFIYDHQGRPLTSVTIKKLQPLNRILERDLQFGQVDAQLGLRNRHRSPGLIWRSQRRWRSPDSLLLPIAHAMAELVCEEDFTHVRECNGPNCTLLFLDRTRGHARRWCSMASCGNRAKQATHRETARDDN